ncbi:hypothetical protein [Denitromonas sp.]|uniref:hypothetical protein n=1 Tax=Denitromonas sp. TaxID=2734609 RepID=UPI003A84FABA
MPRLTNRLPGLLTALAIQTCTIATAAEIRVGPGEVIERIAEAARLAQDGDTVTILPGVYRGDVALWQQDRLTIRGLGDGPILDADGQSMEGKAIWVIRGGTIRIDNITFRGARVPDQNGAGIRFERGQLTVTSSRFIDNENGILTSNDRDARLLIENSVFTQAPHHPGALHHLIYVGRIAHFSLRGSAVHGGYRGHLVKSRARAHRIEYNWLVDGPDGEASYELEFPEGGQATVLGNIIGQSGSTENLTLISYGAEGYHWPDNQLALSHNTLINSRPGGGRFLHVWQHDAGAEPAVMARNNLLIGFGLFALGNPGEFIDNPSIAPRAARNDPDAYRLAEDSLLRGHAGAAPPWQNTALQPTHEFTPPTGTRPLAPPHRWVPGAFQTPPQ